MDVLERVGSSRLMLEGKFPYPSAVDCMRYAIQEMAEYDDAMMRAYQPDHKRNNERQPDPRKELGQAGYMILSAMLYFEKDFPYQSWGAIGGDAIALWAGVVSNVASAIHPDPEFADEGVDAGDLGLAWDCCKALMHLNGWDIDALITETCEAFEAKHMGVQA
jgi:hypothetical protein